MVEEKIKELREELDKSIQDGEKYEKTYKISIALDELIAEYYGQKIKNTLQNNTIYAKI